MLAYRRHSQPDQPTPTPADLPPPWIYQCSRCEQRNLGERRCPDCNLFCRPLGPGGLCPECDQPILLAEFLDAATTI